MTNKDAIKWLGNLRNDLGNPHYECLWPYAQAIDEICELLEEQEPMPPKRIDGKRNHFLKCGSCNADLLSGMRFCPQCGQAVKWDD